MKYPLQNQSATQVEFPCTTAKGVQRVFPCPVSREVFLQGFAPRVDFEGDIAMEHQFRSNALKRRALEIFANYGNLNPPAWAVLAKMLPIRSSYTYLLRLHRFGLLNRERDHRGLLIYAISPRGRERLAWLSGPQSDETILKQHTGDDIWRFNPK